MTFFNKPLYNYIFSNAMIHQINTLNDLKQQLIQFPKEYSVCLNEISYPFIPFTDQSFSSSKNRVLLIGQESKGWQGRLDKFLSDDINFETVIQNSMQRYQSLYSQPAKQSKFLQFLTEIKKINQDQPVQWLNFYLFDYKKSSFNKLSKTPNNDLFIYLRNLSISNLAHQITQLKPRIIFFVGQYHHNFPKLIEELQLSSDEVIKLKNPINKFSMRIWNQETLVLRMPHPAHYSQTSHQARLVALDYFHTFNTCSNVLEFKNLIENS